MFVFVFVFVFVFLIVFVFVFIFVFVFVSKVEENLYCIVQVAGTSLPLSQLSHPSSRGSRFKSFLHILDFLQNSLSAFNSLKPLYD